jgi:hypothetical protein
LAYGSPTEETSFGDSVEGNAATSLRNFIFRHPLLPPWHPFHMEIAMGALQPRPTTQASLMRCRHKRQLKMNAHFSKLDGP